MYIKIGTAFIAISILFSFIPTEKIRDESLDVVKFKSIDQYNAFLDYQKKIDIKTSYANEYEGWVSFSEDKPYVYLSTKQKSGIRKAIEARLKWLGLPHDLEIPLVCSDLNKPPIICTHDVF